MNTIIVTQARVGSSRLPAKVLKKIGDKTILDIHLERLKMSKSADAIILATTNENRSKEIIKIASLHQIRYFLGSQDDVLDRFYQATYRYEPEWIVRVTSDCPLIDPELIDHIIEKAKTSNVDYCSNVIIEDFPDGQDVEVFKFNALKKAWDNAILSSEREHVTPYIKNHSDLKGGKLFKAKDISCHANFNHLRMTVDESDDLDMISWLINEMGINKSWIEYVQHMLKNKDKLVNMNIQRNEGYLNSLKNEK